MGTDGAHPSPVPADAGGDSPHVEVEFEVISVFRPRLVRVRSGEGDAAPQEYPIRVDDEVSGEDGSDDDSLTTIVLWAYYEACRTGAADRDGALPWERPRNSRAWRAFREAMLSDPDRHVWWAHPAERLDRAKEVYRSRHRGFGG